MQIQKINNDKLKVILNSHDLNEKNINIDSFLSNTIESQDLFFEILDLAEQQYNFHIDNSKAVVETISLDNHIFIITITKLKSEYLLASGKPTSIYYFDNIDSFFSCYSFLKKYFSSPEQTYLYELNNQYYLIIHTPIPQVENILLEYAKPISQPLLENFLIEHGSRVY